MYPVFTRLSSESYCRQFRSLLCLWDVFRALISSLVCWFQREGLADLFYSLWRFISSDRTIEGEVVRWLCRPPCGLPTVGSFDDLQTQFYPLLFWDRTVLLKYSVNSCQQRTRSTVSVTWCTENQEYSLSELVPTENQEYSVNWCQQRTKSTQWTGANREPGVLSELVPTENQEYNLSELVDREPGVQSQWTGASREPRVFSELVPTENQEYSLRELVPTENQE